MEWLKKKRCHHNNKKLKHGSPAKPDSDLESDFEQVGEAEDADHDAEGTDHEIGIEKQKQIEAERTQDQENKMKKEIEEELRIVKEIRIRKKVEEELRIEEEKMMHIRIKEEMTIEEEKRIKEQSRLEKEKEEEIRIRMKIEEEMRTEEEKRIKEQMTTKEEKRREEVLQIQKQATGSQDPNQIQLQEKSPEEQSAEDPLEAKARENVMQMPLNALSLMDFELLLNTKAEEDLLTYLVMKLNFNAWEKDKVVWYSAGGGKPHEKFVDLLIRTKIDIDEVIDAAEEIGNEKVVELLTDLRDNHDVEFTNEINPCDAWQLYLPLTLDPKDPVSKRTSWKGLSGTLNRAEIIRDLEVTKEFGGVYSKTQAFLDVLETRGAKVGFLLDKFEENFGSNAPNKTAVVDCFKKAVDRKIVSERKKLERLEKKNKGR